MALKVGELYGVLRLDDKDFGKGIDSARGKFGSLVGGVAKGGVLIAGALAGATAAVGGLSFKLANEASDLNESMSKVGVVFGDWAEDVIHFSEGSAAAFGMSQQAALEAAGTYGNLFDAMGIGKEKTTEMSTGLVQLAGDLASFNNMDPTEVLDALRSGLTGETEPLKRLGVNINQARLEAKALEMGLWDGETAISAAAKAQATYALVLEDTANAQGDFARTSDGMANQQRILGATFEDVMAKLGQAAIPIFEAILPKVTDALQGVATWASDNGPAIEETLTGMFTTVGDVVTWFIENAWPLLLDGFNFLVENVIPPVVDAIMWLVEDVIPALADTVSDTAENVMPILAEAFRIITEEVIPAVAAAFTWISENVIPVLVAVFQALHGWIVENWPTISAIVEQVAGAIGTAFGFISAVIGAVWPVVEAIASVLFPLVGNAATILLGVLETAFNAIGGVFEVVGEVSSAVFQAITRVWGGMSGFFTGVWDTVASAFKGGVNFVIGLVNKLIGFLNDIRIPIPRVTIPGTDIGVGGGYLDPFNIGRIPYLARGGRVLGAGLAIVGEEGPELVALGRGAEVVPLDRGGDGGVTVQMTVQPREVVDAHDVGLEARRLVRLGLRRRRRRAGALA